MDIDELFTLKNLYYIGSYLAAVQEAESLNNYTNNPECAFFFMRSLIELNQFSKVEEILQQLDPQDNQNILVPINFLLNYNKNPQDDTINGKLKQILNQKNNNNEYMQLVAGLIYTKQGLFNDALRAIRNGQSLEIMSLMIQIFLKIDRVDLAKKQINQMEQIDDDATLTQMSMAWLNLALGGLKQYKEAAFMLQELIDKWQSSSILVNGLAVANMNMKKFTEAEDLLKELIQDNGTPDETTLINLLVCSLHLRRSNDFIEKLQNQLKEKNPQHPFLVSKANVDQAFLRESKQFQPTKA